MHAVIGLLVAASALGTATGAPRHGEPITLRSEAAVADCRAGGLQHYPPYLDRGLTLTLALRGPIVPDDDYRILDELLVGFRRFRFIVNDSSMIALSSPTVAGRAAVDSLIRQACRAEQVSAFRLTGVRTVDIREHRRTDALAEIRRAAQARAERRAGRRRLAEERALCRRRLRAPPTPEELTPLVRAEWQAIDPGQAGQFSRVRDVQCRRRRGFFYCRVGLLSSSARGPEYDQADMLFGRNADGALDWLPIDHLP